MKTLFKVLRFFGLLERNNNLSITNVAVIMILTKAMIAPTFTITECGALLLALLNYAHKRYESAKVEKAEKQAAIAAVDTKPLEDAVKALQAKMEQVATDTAEAKDKASKAALAMNIQTKKY